MAFRKPAEVRLGAKVLVFGKKATGKSWFLLSWPGIAAIDAETGLAWYEGKEVGKNLVAISNTQSFREMEDDAEEIADNYEELGVKTFAIDSVTKIKENLEETIMVIDERREKRKGKDVDETNLSIRSRGRIKYTNKRLQNVKIDLSTKGINIVDIAQAKEVKEKQGDQFVLVGHEPDMQKGADHDYDIVLFFYTEVGSDGKLKYKAEVQKDRLNVYKTGDVIDSPTYAMWKDVIEGREGKEMIDTSFAEDTQDSKDRYEKETDLAEAGYAEKFSVLIKTLSDDDKKKLTAELAAKKIKGFEGLSPNQKAALGTIYKTFSGKNL